MTADAYSLRRPTQFPPLDGISVDINEAENVVCFGDEAIIEYLITGEGIFDIVIDNGSEVIYEETVVNGDADLLEFNPPKHALLTIL